MRQFLVVANRTLGGGHLLDCLHALHAEEPSRFYVVVPATPVSHHLAWTEGESSNAAGTRLSEALRRFAHAGIDARGEVGDTNPVIAVKDACLGHDFDGIVLSTLPPGASRWIHQDLPHRLARTTRLRVIHVIAAPEAATASRIAL